MFYKNMLVCFFLLVFFAPNLSYGQKDKKFFRNDYVYLDTTESFYKINSIPKNFTNAKAACFLEGATLWYPDDQEEADAVISYWNSTQPTWWSVTLGISNFLIKGLFMTVDGKRLADVYHNWSIGEPNNYLGIEDCVDIRVNGKMLDIPCHIENPFICKKTLQSLEWDQQCNMPDLGYTFIERSGRCYKLHSIPLNWTDAYNVCSAEQSYLAVVNNWLEVDDLISFADVGPKRWDGGSYIRGIYHVGFHNIFNHGWQTIHGAPFNDSLLWWGRQPVGGTYDRCGSMFYMGRMTQIDCGLKCLFLCEHEVSQPYTARDNEDN